MKMIKKIVENQFMIIFYLIVLELVLEFHTEDIVLFFNGLITLKAIVLFRGFLILIISVLFPYRSYFFLVDKSKEEVLK